MKSPAITVRTWRNRPPNKRPPLADRKNPKTRLLWSPSRPPPNTPHRAKPWPGHPRRGAQWLFRARTLTKEQSHSGAGVEGKIALGSAHPSWQVHRTECTQTCDSKKGRTPSVHIVTSVTVYTNSRRKRSFMLTVQMVKTFLEVHAKSPASLYTQIHAGSVPLW